MDHRIIHPLGAGQDVQWRDSGDGQNMTLTGHAAVFDRLSERLWIWAGEFYERIAPGAFTDVLASTDLDVRLLFNHNPDIVFARSSAGTLELSQDDVGLRVWAKVAPTTQARDLRLNMEAGNVSQMSFAFEIGDEEQTGTRDGLPIYTILRAKSLLDVSPVTYPAYPDTDASMRARFIREASRRYGIDPQKLVAQPEIDAAGAPNIAPEVVGVPADREHKLRILKVRARVAAQDHPLP